MNSVLVNLDGRQINVVVESGGIGAAASISLAEAQAAQAAAEAAAAVAEAAALAAEAATEGKADIDGSNIVAPATFAEAIGLGAADAPTFAGGTLKGAGTILSVQKADADAVFTVSTTETYTGTGTATLGAGRSYFGTLTPSGDDSAINIGRNIAGTGLFSHAIRDESVFTSNNDSAYTSFDGTPTWASNSGAKYNHGYIFQARGLMSATNGMDLLCGTISNLRVANGRVDRLYHLYPQSLTLSAGGTVGQHVGLFIPTLTGGDVFNYAIYSEGSPVYIGGATQFGGTVSGATVVEGDNLHATGATVTYFASGGISFSKPALYGVIQGYADAVGTVNPIALNPAGGQILVGSGTPVLGGALEVVGQATATNMKTGEIIASDLNATGGFATFQSGGGVLVCKPSTFGLIRAYSNNAGAAQTLNLNDTGGQVLVGGPTNTTNKALEVVGSVSVSGDYYVDDVKVVSNRGAAVTDAVAAAGVPTQAEFNAFVTQFNALLARLRSTTGHGLIT